MSSLDNSSEQENSFTEIRTNFESGRYDVVEAPRVLQIDYSGVYVHKDGLSQNVRQSLECQKAWRKDRILNNKLKGHGYGEYDLGIGFISNKYFESREKFDSLYSNLWISPDEQSGDLVPVKIVDQISLEQALLDTFSITLSCELEYYLSNRKEMEQDLGHKLEELDVNNESLMKRFEVQLFRSNVLKIFGEEPINSDEETLQSAVTFKDFRVLYSDGNDKYASAIRGEQYFIFYYATS